MPDAEVAVVYVDDALLVLEKPSGLLSVPGRGDDKQDCLSARAQQRFADALVVHRLDMATSGLLVMARGAVAQRLLSAAFARREVLKRYIAVVDGLPDPGSSSWNLIDLPISLDWINRPRRIIDRLGKPSTSRWRVLEQNPDRHTTRVELEALTGRSHQLRVHMKALNHPILGDSLYGTPESFIKSNRLLLHASQLALKHPFSMESLAFSSAPEF